MNVHVGWRFGGGTDVDRVGVLGLTGVDPDKPLCTAMRGIFSSTALRMKPSPTRGASDS